MFCELRRDRLTALKLKITNLANTKQNDSRTKPT